MMTSLSPPLTTRSGVWPARAQVNVPAWQVDHRVRHGDEAAIVEVVGEQIVEFDEERAR